VNALCSIPACYHASSSMSPRTGIPDHPRPVGTDEPPKTTDQPRVP
jgi:hypothetical protein